MHKKRVLVGSPVYQKKEILEAFLQSLEQLNGTCCSLDFMFVDDNVEKASSDLLAGFAPKDAQVFILKGEEMGEYICDDETHNWTDGLMHKVANYKNKIIAFALEKDYDYLFLADSDLVLHPNLIAHLMSVDKEIVSEIFWSSWHTDAPSLPNVWLYNEYDFATDALSEREGEIAKETFLHKLKTPGVYKVGGLGACTLLHRTALEKGVNFKPIYNLTIHGEDRFFCIRTAVLGIDLYVDTHYPAYHIYREGDLAGVSAYKAFCKQDNDFRRTYKTTGNTITLSMIVKNEGGRYLKEVLSAVSRHIDQAVIIDDGSSDDTVAICKEVLKNIPLHIVQNSQSMFSREWALRKQQWAETVKTNPDWILSLDADEVLEESFWQDKERLLNDRAVDVYTFRLYDMWNDTCYREDEYWNAHGVHRPFLVRYQPAFPYIFQEAAQHCQRFPVNMFSHPSLEVAHRIKHMGWKTPEDRLEKKERYARLDPDAIFGIKEQYDSILEQDPCLKEFSYDK